MDEPFTNLDDAGRAFVEARIAARLDSGGMAVVASHHDLNLGGATVRTIPLGGSA
jgi:ABC-type transport system involved in cytochrome c biogenesis ATPase subunit